MQHLKGDLLEALNANETKPYRALSADTEGLVSWTTIYRFMKSQGVCLYTQRPLPLLSDLQKERHVAYCIHRLNNWGVPPQKTLLINFDEKWWYGRGNPANAKLCKNLNFRVERNDGSVKHRDNTPKVMGVGLVAFAYDGDVENGGEGVKIGLY